MNKVSTRSSLNLTILWLFILVTPVWPNNLSLELDQEGNDMFMPPACTILQNTSLDNNLAQWNTAGTVTSTTDSYASAEAAQIEGFYAYIFQTQSGITEGNIYSLSAYCKTESSPWWTTLSIRFYDASWSNLGETYVQVTSSTYEQYQISAIAPANAAHVEVRALKFGSGLLKVDEFCLEESTPVIGDCILVHNSGFEDNFTNWSIGGSVNTDSDAYSGSNAAQLIGNGSGIAQRLLIRGGDTYEFSAYAKVSASAPNYAELYLEWRDVNNNMIHDIVQPIISVVKDYQQFSLKGKAPANAAYAVIGAYKSGSSSRRLFVDDICFKKIDPLGGNSFDLTCGCSDELLPNGGYEEYYTNWFGESLEGIPVSPISDGASWAIPPHRTDINNDYMFLVQDLSDNVNNPEGDHFIFLADDDDEMETRVHFGDDLALEDGEEYTVCFYAASWVASLGSDDLPDGGTEIQRAGVANLQFMTSSGMNDVASYSIPASESFTNLSWTKCSYTFTHNSTDPVQRFEINNERNNIGIAIDALSITKINCQSTVECGQNGLNYHRWENVSSSELRELLTHETYPNIPDHTDILTNYQGPINLMSNYGTRVFGYIVPNVTGNYIFNITGDDDCRFFLSSDSTFQNKSMLARINGWTNITEHNKYTSQTSSSIYLEAGQKYYTEFLHKEGGGGDHFQVYWQTPMNTSWNIIPNANLRPICYPEDCNNGRDDDLDGLTDCEDDDCSGALGTSITITDENCGSGGGIIDLESSSLDTPLSFQWSDMPLCAHWNFEGSTDDASGNLNHAAWISGSPAYSGDAVEGRFSIYFNGSTRIRYSIDGGFMEQAFSALSVSVWVKPDNLIGQKSLLDEGGSSSCGGRGFAIDLNNNIIRARVRNGNCEVATSQELVFPNDGNWHLITAVFDNGNLTTYLDGAASSTVTAPFTTVDNHGNNGGVGGNFGGSVLAPWSNRYIGLMDDFRYYCGYALTPEQVTDLARNDGDRTNLFAGTYNVTITTASGCSSVETAVVNSASNHSDGGQISGDETFCGSSADPGNISSISSATGGGAGTTEYQWQMSTDGGGLWTDIPGATSASFDPPTISETTLYRRGGRLVPCLAYVYSNEITKSFTINFTDAGSISGYEIVCDSYDPVQLSNDVLPSGGSGGTTEFQWQSSTDSLNWTDIVGANVDSHDPGMITQTTWYRRGARRTPCVDFLFTSTIKKDVVNNYTDGGIIAGEEDFCGSYDPSGITSATLPSGGVGGTLEYQWQSREGTSGAWSDISGATAETYDPTTIISTRQYRRGCRRNPCVDFVYSNTITKMVVVNFNNGGAITGDQSECGTYDPSVIANFAPPSGGVDGYQTYQWEASTDGGTNWADVAGANSAFYDPALLSETTVFRRKSRRSPCAAWINSNVVTKEVREVPNPALIQEPTAINGFICEFITYTFEADDAGVGASYGWDFGSFATPSTATGPGPHEVIFNVSNIAAFSTASVQLTVYQSGCAGIAVFDYDVRPQIVVSNIATVDPTSCNVNDGSISVTTDHPGGTVVEGSIDGGANWITEPLDFDTLAAGAYDLLLRYDGQECEYEWGTITLTDPGSLTADIVLSTTDTCINEMFWVEAIPSGIGNPTYSWDFGPGATPVIAYGVGPHLVSYSFGSTHTIQLAVSENFCTGIVDTVIDITQTYSDGGTLTGDEDLCSPGPGTSMDTQTAPSGGFGGTADYQWEYREDDGAGGWTSWTEIAGATASAYTPAFINVTTQYRRKARRLPCPDWAISAPVTKRLSGVPQPQDDIYTQGCPGFIFFDYVNQNDLNIINPVYTIATPPTNGTLDLDTDGEFVYTPNTAFCGTDEFTYRVCNNGTTCCATATVSIDLTDAQDPVLQNIPSDLNIHCDDEVPLPPIVDAWENCHSVTLGLDESSNQGILDSCSIYSYSIYRTWSASDYCGNSTSEQQVINIQDNTAPDIYRIYTLPNGSKMVAGVMENVTHRWKNITLPIDFPTTPVILAQVVTDNDNTTVVPRLRNISGSYFQMRIQEEENEDDIHAEESVAWIAFEEGVNTDALPFEVGKKLSSSSTSTLSFDQPYSNPGFICGIQTFNENNPVAPRYDNLNSTTVEIYLQEEESLDPETNHGFEILGYVAFDDEGDITNDLGEVVGETGQLSIDHNTVTVNLNHTYHNPVVVLGGVSTESSHEAMIRVSNVTSTSFDVNLQEWMYQNGWHPEEDVTYMVVEGSIPFDQIVECSDIPEVPILGQEIVGLDNCDVSTPVTVTDGAFSFDCENDIYYERTFHVQDECGNTSTFTQTFTLRDTTPPTFTAPADLTITCLTDEHDLTITGDVTDEMDNCADDLEATYVDNTSNIIGCTGYFVRVWTLTDLCLNSVQDTQYIYIFNDNDGDEDGIPDPFDLDDDNDGIPDADEGTADLDGDGIPNYLDLDSDNDGIPDIIEAGLTDADGDGRIDTYGQADWDIDGDGLGNIVDGDPFDPSEAASDVFESFDGNRDYDNDGIPNWYDLDSDNDGIPDLIEAGGADSNGDGIVDYPDPANAESMVDADGDGFFDAFDPDDDNIPGVEDITDFLINYSGGEYSSGSPSYPADFDGDGIPDIYDLDSDNDGIADLIEVGGVDTDGDGQIDAAEFTDFDGNGLHDEYDTVPLVYTDEDTVGDDGRADDNDGDGSVFNLIDVDRDGAPNQRDTDADNDNINDIVETGYAALDINNDGVIDVITDINTDGFNDGSVGQIFTEGDGLNNDGRPEDSADVGTSNYGSAQPDGTFGQSNGEPDLDDDGDGIPNFLDTDSDNDLLVDNLEDTNGNGLTDTGETGYLDPDSDDDLIIDGLEDTNLDGQFQEGIETDPLNPDTDGDGLEDGFEDSNQDGVFDPNAESDPKDPCDPIINPACIGVRVQARVKLKGALPFFGVGGNIMHTKLLNQNLIPQTEPYTDLPYFSHVGDGGGEIADPSAFAQTGGDAIVDWVFLELREPSNWNIVVNTRSALLQADGDVVDMDGTSAVFFPTAPSGFYHVSVRHRNHLGTGTISSFGLSPDPTLVDMTSASTNVFGPYGTDELSSGEKILWPGDMDGNGRVIFQGPNNDGFYVFLNVMTDPDNLEQLPNFISNGYYLADYDMDGRSIYQGPSNDRAMILFYTVTATPENPSSLVNFIVQDKLP